MYNLKKKQTKTLLIQFQLFVCNMLAFAEIFSLTSPIHPRVFLGPAQ